MWYNWTIQHFYTQSVRQSVRHWGLKLQWAGGHCCSYHVKGTKTNSRGSDYIILTFSCRLPEGQFWPADREFETPGGNVWRKSHRVCCLLYLYSRVQNGPERTDHRQRHWTYCHKYRCRYQGDHHHIYHGCCRGRQSRLDTLETDRKTCMNWVECSWRLKFNVRLPRSSHQGSPAHKNHGNTWASRSCRCRRWDSRCSWPQTRWEGHISQPPGHRRRPEERAAREWTWRDTGRQVLRRDDRTFSVALGGHLEAGDLHGPQLIYSRERTSFNKKKKVWHPQGGAAVIKVLPEDQRLTAHRIVRQGWVRSAGSRCRRRFRR